MLKNYFKIALRNLLKNKGFSAINIVGLAIGMASAILILLWIRNELSIDRVYPKTDRLYMMYNRDKFDGGLWAWNNTPKPMAPVLRKDYAGVEDAARFNNVTFLTSVDEVHLNTQGAFADSSFLSMFDLTMLHGDPVRALNGTYNIVLTERLAKRLFGNGDAMGKTVRIDSTSDFTVTGILKDLAPTTSFNFDYLLPWSFMTRLGWDDNSWGNNSIYTYVLLKPGVLQSTFDAQVRNITTSHSQETAEVFTQPMSRFHLYSKPENGKLVGDIITTVRLFIVIAAFILLIACINFMNLSTARSERRAREVGIRKVVGAGKGGLIGQFIGESILISLMAFVIALGIAQLSLPAFSQLVGKQLAIDYASTGFWLFALGFVLFTGLLAGSYPAFYLSSFRPVKVLKGAFKQSNALVTPRKLLVVLQFSFAILLIICTFIIQKQIRYGLDRDAGYNRDNLVYAFTQGDAARHYDLIRRDLLASGAAVSVSRTNSPITQQWSDGWGYSWSGSTAADDKRDFTYFAVDANFIKTMGTTLLQGRDIDINQYPTDTTAVLLNESAVKAMRLKNPIGEIIKRDSDRLHVVGVIKDFIIGSPYSKEVAPMMVNGPNRFLQVIHFKLNPAAPVASDLAKAGKIFRKYNPRYPFEYYFADESYARKFRDQQQIGKLSALFAGLSIFISCLGLFALATYMAENRIREIGIRKVLGASVTGITTLLAKDFVKLVGVAFVIAAPIGWVIMNKWLAGYGYHISIGWDIFAWSGLLALVIAVGTVSYQSVRAAVANPVKSLRAE